MKNTSNRHASFASWAISPTTRTQSWVLGYPRRQWMNWPTSVGAVRLREFHQSPRHHIRSQDQARIQRQMTRRWERQNMVIGVIIYKVLYINYHESSKPTLLFLLGNCLNEFFLMGGRWRGWQAPLMPVKSLCRSDRWQLLMDHEAHSDWVWQPFWFWEMGNGKWGIWIQ